LFQLVFKNLSANHRANDVIVLEDKEQILTAKFSYGPLDFALSGEKVDIYITNATPSNHQKSSSSYGEWKLLASGLTDSHGRLKYEIPKDRRLPLGMYQVKCIVKCDRTWVEFQLAVLPTQTESVVFSIDGSFAANISFSGTDPKVRAGAVDVVRYWQDLGYLIIYITARPDIQHYKVTNWLAQHNFPLGMVFFSEGICRDPIRQKTESLRSIVIGSQLKLQAGYGSPKDIHMYASLGVPANRIFIIGKAKNKYLNHAVVKFTID
jgi:phosphatidate phosphatase PAH1